MTRWSASWLLVFASAVVLVPNAWADVNDLSGGVFIAHYVAELPFTTEPPAGGWCQAYDSYAISSSAEQVNRVDIGGTGVMPVSWYVLAAWTEPKRWCCNEFGLGEFDPGLFLFVEWSACSPGDYLELSSPGWPGPNTGTAFVTTNPAYIPWEGSIAPVYWFGGYAYAASAPGRIPLGLDPQQGSAGWVTCQVVPVIFEAECLGALGFNTDGVACHPIAPGAAACCVGQTCYLLPEPECTAMGGQWYPAHASCEPNPCVPSPVEGASWGRIKSIYQ